MRNQIINPQKPILLSDFRCYIKLKKNEVDISDIGALAKKEGYREQTNRHITIIGKSGSEIIRNVFNNLKPKEKSQIAKKIQEIIRTLDWRFIPENIYHISRRGYLDESRKADNRESYIRTIKMPAMKKFYQRLGKLLNNKLEPRFSHITLFTRGEKPNPEYYGIPIISHAMFRKLYPQKYNQL